MTAAAVLRSATEIWAYSMSGAENDSAEQKRLGALMNASMRVLVIDKTDRMFRMDITKVERMIHKPKTHSFPQLAGQRVRSAEAIVELVDRKPVRIVRMYFSIWRFDNDGFFDLKLWERQHGWARRRPIGIQESADGSATVLDARHVFSGRGGDWEPTESILRAIKDAALGKVRVPRLGA